MLTISASVGVGGVNAKADVLKIQQLLRKAHKNPGPEDGIFGLKTKTALLGFQSTFLTKPDGRIDPTGTTLRHLNNSVSARLNTPAPVLPRPQPQAPAATHTDWGGDSAQWTQEKKLLSLKSSFRTKVERVISALIVRGYQPKIIYGWRSVAVQRVLFNTHKSKVLFSFHNAQTPEGIPSSWAADIVDKRYLWNEPNCMPFFKALGEEARKEGMEWGGDWQSFRDWAHIQGRRNSDLGLVKRESGL